MQKKLWLQKLTGVIATEQKTEEELNQKKQAMLSQMWNDVNVLAEKQKDNFDITLQAKKTDKEKTVLDRGLDPKKEQKMLDYQTRDQTEEFDLDEIQDGFGVASTEDLLKLSEAINTSEQLVQRMKSMKNPNKKVKVIKKSPLGAEFDKEVDEDAPLFTDEEIAAELYQPLVRQGLLPETFVPDKLSQTRETIDKSFGAYKERNKSEKPKDFLDENFNLMMASAGLLLTGVNVGLTGSKLQQGLQGDDGKATESQLMDQSSSSNYSKSWTTNLAPTQESHYAGHVDQIANDVALFNNVAGLGSAAWDGKEDIKDKKSDLTSAKEPGEARLANLPRIAQSIVSGLAAHLSKAFAKGNLSMTVGAAFGALVKPQTLANDLKGDAQGKAFVLKKTHTDKVVKCLGDALEQTMKACAKKATGNTKTVTTKTVLENAGTKMNKTFTAKCKSADLLAALQEKDGKLDPGKAITLVTQAGEAAIADVETTLEPILKDKNALDEMSKGLDEEMSAKLRQDIQDADAQEEEEKRQFEIALKGKDPKELMSIIEKKTLQLKQDEKIIKWFFNLAGMAMSQAAQAVAPLAMLGSGLKMLQNGRAAIKRGLDWHEFRKREAPLFRAASEFAPALANMINNAGAQFSHYTFVVAMEGLNYAGAFIQCTGCFMGIGVALQTAVSGAEALESWILELAKRRNLSKAWELYKLALSRPDNRKLGLLAMKQNPTLAKYAIAFGAIIRKDPLVADLLRYCGISEDNVLDLEGKIDEKQVNAKLDKVVSYLEARMPDDITVVGRTVKLSDWAPSPVELTLACWTGAKKRGEAKANLKKGTSTSDIDVALTQLSGIFEDARKKHQADPKHPDTLTAVEECQDVLAALETAFKAYQPRMVDESGREMDHGPMKHLVQEFLQKVAAARKEFA